MNPTHPSGECFIPAKLAAAFRRSLRGAIGARLLARVDALNVKEFRPNVCHSHDFCDANVYMARAFRRVVGREIDLQSDDDVTLWAVAWSRFKLEGAA